MMELASEPEPPLESPHHRQFVSPSRINMIHIYGGCFVECSLEPATFHLSSPNQDSEIGLKKTAWKFSCSYKFSNPRPSCSKACVYDSAILC
ncbi:hypothetical protein AVEN_58379-1 [Araneus ventricosus]|uniref:Uncharacterized protein n=1 Tax=Araneus ventricosus TaxID=182803 RepID=A0A4Y2KPU0_ARAVE|nr:hypothetical protein AVEN_58379-1 [Araneus ventricosus]